VVRLAEAHGGVAPVVRLAEAHGGVAKPCYQGGV
jgi:hypothetical protein